MPKGKNKSYKNNHSTNKNTKFGHQKKQFRGKYNNRSQVPDDEENFGDIRRRNQIIESSQSEEEEDGSEISNTSNVETESDQENENENDKERMRKRKIKINIKRKIARNIGKPRETDRDRER